MSKDFESIMREITRDLTGDLEKDMSFLKQKCQEYKNHEMATEIARACGRLMYEMLPDDRKEELDKVFSNDVSGTEAAIDEIKFNIYKKDYDKALKMAEDLVSKIESMNLFQDDKVSEYHLFDELFEEILYRHYNNPTKNLRRAEFPYTEIYLLYGGLLVELKRLEDARKALNKGLRWNPMNFSIMSEYIETFKLEGNMEKFFQTTLDAFKIAIHAPQVARCFRNLGYYFAEMKLYPEAVATLLLSTRFDKGSKQVQSELYYISQVAGDIKEPAYEEFKAFSEKYGFPLGADKDVLGLAYAYGKNALDEGEKEWGKYFLTILYELTLDDGVKKMIDSIQT